MPVPGGRRRRWPRHAAYGLAGLAVLVPTGTFSAGWYFATRVIDVSAARQYPIEVRAVGPDDAADGAGLRVTLARTRETEQDMPLALVWPDGFAQLGAVLSGDKRSVVRRVVAVTRGTLRVGLRGYLSGAVFGGDPKTARGLDFAEVMVPTELGDAPAWLVPPVGGVTRSTWVIAVHGRASHRGEALRVLPALAGLGLTTLVVTYRNDEGAPPSPDGYYHLGATESRDVVAAVRYAQQHGATDVVLYGWSMGGGAVLTALRQLSPDDVRGVVLDCPVVEWSATLYHNARQIGLPAPLAWAAVRWIERRLRLRLASLDHRLDADSLRVPVLAFSDDDDRVVDPQPTRDLAELRPDLVTLVETVGAGHARSWNLDPAAYEAALTGFLSDLLADARETP